MFGSFAANFVSFITADIFVVDVAWWKLSKETAMNNADILGAIEQRHSVRNYTNATIASDARASLQQEIDACNTEGNLNIQLITDEPKAFEGAMAHYGGFFGVRNYLALVGPKSSDLDERAGYYGERLVLHAQTLGLNTCWVALTFNKGKSRHSVAPGEKLVCVITLGYGINQGKPHKSKTIEQVSNCDATSPTWFRDGVRSALLAPTAMNQQRFMITLEDNAKVSARSTGGFCAKIDLGIVKYHFEVSANPGNFNWALPAQSR